MLRDWQSGTEVPIDRINCGDCGAVLSGRNSNGLTVALGNLISWTDPDTGLTSWWRQAHVPKFVRQMGQS